MASHWRNGEVYAREEQQLSETARRRRCVNVRARRERQSANERGKHRNTEIPKYRNTEIPKIQRVTPRFPADNTLVFCMSNISPCPLRYGPNE